MGWGYIYIKNRGKPSEPEAIDAAVYTNVLFAASEPGTAAEENWFETEGGGEAGVIGDINADEGCLAVLRERDRDTKFLSY